MLRFAFTAGDGLAMSSRKACGIISSTKGNYTLKSVRPICNSLILMFLINSWIIERDCS